LPDNVHDVDELIGLWKQILATSPDKSGLGCGICPAIDSCFGSDSRMSGRIVPLSFFPFYMLTFPAPSLTAENFIAMLGDKPPAEPRTAKSTIFWADQYRFLFHDEDRQFFEILYLKLTFLAQVCRQYLTVDGKGGCQEFDLSLEGIGVDLSPSGAGLPAFWNFNVRILDAIGAFQLTPFAPIVPEAPRLHFLGALWFRTLLVNARQHADTVFAEVGRRVSKPEIENGTDALDMDETDPGGVFAASQIFWEPGRRNPPENWQSYWIQALRLGFQLVQAGLRTGASWDNTRFLNALEVLRKQIKDKMFSSAETTSVDQTGPQRSARMRRVLDEILGKWLADAAADGGPPLPEPESPSVDARDNGWEQDNQETVIVSVGDGAPPAATPPPGVSESPPEASSWNGDLDATIVLRPDADKPASTAASPSEDLEPTVVISPSANRSAPPPPEKDEDLPATMIKRGADSEQAPTGDTDEEFEPTVILRSGALPSSKKAAPSNDDEIMEQTVIIRSEVNKEKE